MSLERHGQLIAEWTVFDDFSQEISSNRQRIHDSHDEIDEYPYVRRTESVNDNRTRR